MLFPWWADKVETVNLNLYHTSHGCYAVDNAAAEYPTPAVKYGGLPPCDGAFRLGKYDAHAVVSDRLDTGFFQLLPIPRLYLRIKRFVRYFGDPIYIPYKTGGGEKPILRSDRNRIMLCRFFHHIDRIAER